jgi:hypothetical protein
VTRRLGTAIVLLLVLDLVGVWTVTPSRDAAPSQRGAMVPGSTTTALAPSGTAPVAPSRAPQGTPTPRPPTTTTSPPGPSIPVTGRVVDATGRGLPNVNVSVAQHVDLGEGFGAGLAALGLGLSRFGTCIGTRTALECRTSTGGVTGPDGRYELRLPMTVEEGRQVARFDVTADWPGTSGARGPATFAGRGVAAPDVVLWRPEPRAHADRVSWSPLPERARQGATYSVSFSRPGPFGKPEHMWSIAGGADGVSFERRILEDIAATAVVTARSGDRAFWSVPVAVPGPGAPPSRDRPCTALPEDPQGQPVDYGRCPMTDTDRFSRVVEPKSSSQVVVDLGSSRRVELAVVMGYRHPFAVDVSDDRTVWVEVAKSEGSPRATSDHTVAYASQPRSGRYARLRLDPNSFGAWFVEGFAVW